MERREISLHVKQWVQHESSDERELFEVKAKGELVELSTFSRITYTDNNDVKIELKWRPQRNEESKRLEIKQPAHSMFFDLAQNTMTPYHTPQGIWQLEIETKKMSWQSLGDGYQLDLAYEIKHEQEMLGKYEFQLIYK